MDVDVATLAFAGPRIGPGDCVLRRRCVQACPKGALHLTFGAARPAAVVLRLPGGRT